MAEIIIVDYGTLKTALTGYLYARKDLADQIGTFVQLGEKKIFRRLESLQNEIILETTSPTPIFSVPLPADYKSTKMITVDDEPLVRESELAFKKMQKNRPGSGAPKKVARIKDDLIFYPTPDSNYTVWHYYYADLGGALVADEDTNAVLIAYPDLYLYAAMIEAMPYLVKDSRTPAWKEMYSDAMNSANEATFDEEYSGSVNQVSQPYGDYGGRDV